MEAENILILMCIHMSHTHLSFLGVCTSQLSIESNPTFHSFKQWVILHILGYCVRHSLCCIMPSMNILVVYKLSHNRFFIDQN
jgi:hypothetical protein